MTDEREMDWPLFRRCLMHILAGSGAGFWLAILIDKITDWIP